MHHATATILKRQEGTIFLYQHNKINTGDTFEVIKKTATTPAINREVVEIIEERPTKGKFKGEVPTTYLIKLGNENIEVETEE